MELWRLSLQLDFKVERVSTNHLGRQRPAPFQACTIQFPSPDVSVLDASVHSSGDSHSFRQWLQANEEWKQRTESKA